MVHMMAHFLGFDYPKAQLSFGSHLKPFWIGTGSFCNMSAVVQTVELLRVENPNFIECDMLATLWCQLMHMMAHFVGFDYPKAQLSFGSQLKPFWVGTGSYCKIPTGMQTRIGGRVC